MKLKQEISIHLPDTRGVVISDWGKGNPKLGKEVYTYSRLAGIKETCPGASEECEVVCYAKKLTRYEVVYQAWERHGHEMVPDFGELPLNALIRIHVSGDFTTVSYIDSWTAALEEREDVRMWGYTRSWRVPSLLPSLELLRALPNVEMFASMDSTIPELPPDGWRRAWLDGDRRADPVGIRAHKPAAEGIKRNRKTMDGAMSYVCPEETNHKASCEACRYCFDGRRGDVTFLLH